MPRPTIAFDLDGTLVDTAPDLLKALDATLEIEGLNPPEAHEARNFIGAGARVMIERALAFNQVQFGKEKVDGMFSAFLSHYEDHIADHSRPFPGVEQALARLAAEGALMVVCTNKFERYAAKLLDALKLADRFAFIAGGDTFKFRKPDPRHLIDAIERAGGDTDHAVLIGDSETDVVTARAAEIPVVAVSFGYTDIPPAALGADALVHKFEDVPAAALNLLNRRRLA
jgi:phosphoglycolate phosphatase